MNAESHGYGVGRPVGPPSHRRTGEAFDDVHAKLERLEAEFSELARAIEPSLLPQTPATPMLKSTDDPRFQCPFVDTIDTIASKVDAITRHVSDVRSRVGF